MHNNAPACARRRGAATFAALALAAAGGVAATLAPPLAALSAAACVAAVDGAPQAAPAPAKPPEAPTAAEILERAIARQGLPKGVDPAAAAPLTLTAKVNLQFRDDKGNDVALQAKRRYLAPSFIWTELKDQATGSVTQSGFDGKAPWFWSASTGIRLLSGPDGANDLKQLTSDVEITAALARSLLLARLRSELKELRRLDDVARGEAKLWAIEGDAVVDLNDKRMPTKLRLLFEPKDAQLAGVRVAFEGRDPLQMWFPKHAVEAGFEFPRKIEVFREVPAPPPPAVAAAGRPQLTIVVYELDLAPRLTDADFAPPR